MAGPGVQQVKLGAGSVPRPGQKPPVLSFTGFSYWSQPWAGAAEPQASWPRTGQWFGPHNQQDAIFGAACCLLLPLQGCDGADRSMAASQPGPSVPFAPLACLMHDYFHSCFNLPRILIRNVFSLLAALSVFHVCSQQQLLSALHTGLCPASAALLPLHLFLGTACWWLSQSHFGNYRLIKEPFQMHLGGKDSTSVSFMRVLCPFQPAEKFWGGNSARRSPVVSQRQAKQNSKLIFNFS